MVSPPRHVWLVLSVSVCAISTAAVLVSAIDDAPPIAIAIWRTAAIALLLSPFIRPVSRRDLLHIAIAGACLGAHFATWFASLQLTTVLRSTVLVCMGPVWTGLIEWGSKSESPSSRYWLGLCISIPCAIWLSVTPGDGGSLTGDGLALLGGLLASVYLVLGRGVRQRVGIGSYAGLVCAFAALALLPVALVTDTPLFGFSWTTWALIGGLAAGPQLLGHNGFNYALKFVPASSVSAATLLEPVGATILAWLWLNQTPTLTASAAGVGVVGGVLWAALPSTSRLFRRRQSPR
ncbi:MAG: drug/metabolite transporter (DMT)-like permease [Kiritimatiellia bacterium]|jgi:drug/metabolite transporter (DMT)-like permease